MLGFNPNYFFGGFLVTFLATPTLFNLEVSDKTSYWIILAVGATLTVGYNVLDYFRHRAARNVTLVDDKRVE